MIAPPRWERGKSLCAYCGENIATTADHVIPKNLFIVKDKQMITVPSCEQCQKEKGMGERDLRNFCNLEIGGSMHGNAFEQAKRIGATNEATRKWLKRTIETAEEVIFVDESDNEVGRGLAADFTTDKMMETLNFIFKGLYYLAYGDSLPKDCPVESTVVPWEIFPDFMRKFGKHRKHDPIVKGNLTAWYTEINTVPEDPLMTMWVFCVNDGVGFYGMTGAAALAERRRKAERKASQANQPRQGLRRVRAPRDANGRLLLHTDN